MKRNVILMSLIIIIITKTLFFTIYIFIITEIIINLKISNSLLNLPKLQILK